MLQTELAALTDAQLDQAFAACWDVRDYAAADVYGGEIRNRLVSPTSFIGGLFGSHRFPLFEARIEFSQSGAAQGSLVDSAGNVVTAVDEAIKSELPYLILGAVAAIVLSVVLR